MLQSMGSQRVRHSLATEQLDSNFLARNIFEFCMHSLLNSKKIQLTKQESFFFFFPTFLRDLTLWASLVAQLVKNPPTMQETSVQFLGQEDPLEKG